MATNFPTSLDSYTTKVDAVTDVLASHINNPQDAIVALETKVGVTGSAVTTTHDYKIAQLESGKAPLASPTLTGTVTIPTPFTLGAISVTPTGTELNYMAGVTSAVQTQLNNKAPTAAPTFTGTVTIPTPFTLGSTSVTSTGTELNYVAGVTSAIQTQLNTKAPLASPTFTGTPAAATAAVGTNTTQLATTAFARANVGQMQYHQRSDVVTCSTSLPQDDTIPQNTEGTEIFSVAITPKSATSLLLIEVTAVITPTSSFDPVLAVFQDSTVNAICATTTESTGAGGESAVISLRYLMVAGTTSATTFKARLGAATGAVYLNGSSSGAGYFGGVFFSSMTVTEIPVL